jgi:hypothetical protein
MKTYKLYQVDMVMNAPICTFIAQVEAADESAAEDLLLENLPANNVEYLITVVK